LDDQEEETKSNDQEPTIIEAEEQEIEKRKPPNDKITYYRIIDESEDKTDS